MPILILTLMLQSGLSDGLIEKLRSEKAEARESATREVRALGEAARPGLVKLSKDSDQELAARARNLLESLDSDSAERIFQKLMSTMLEAKSVRLQFASSGMMAPDRKFEMSGCVLLQEGGKFRIKTDLFVDQRHTEFLLRFDGSVLSHTTASWPAGAPKADTYDSEHDQQVTATSLGRESRQGFVQLGLSLTSTRWMWLSRVHRGEIEGLLVKGNTLGSFKLGPDQGAQKALRYEIRNENDRNCSTGEGSRRQCLLSE
jgi:hypothetical protein